MERYKVLDLAMPYNRFYFVKDADDWSREMDFEWHQRTKPKRC